MNYHPLIRYQFVLHIGTGYSKLFVIVQLMKTQAI